MKKITEKEYNMLNLNEALEYSSVGVMCCNTEECENYRKHVTVDSRKPPHNFVYANIKDSDTNIILSNRFVPSRNVCKCMFVMDTVEIFFLKNKEEKYRVNVTKAKGDRGKHYYRDFSKTSSITEHDPEMHKNMDNTISEKELSKISERLSKL